METKVSRSTVEIDLGSGANHVVHLNGGRLNGEAALAAALPVASALGESLRTPPCSPMLLTRATEIMSIYEEWDWGHLVPIDAEPREDTATPADGIGAFFTGGVDSTFTALRHPEITHLVYVLGFDVPLDNHQLWSAVRHQLETAAEVLGKEFMIVETDLRLFSNNYVGWLRYHGPALAFVAHALKSVLGKVFIPASWTLLEQDKVPWGSHPRLDNKWSTGDLTLVHDGADVHRTEKTGYLGEHPETLRWLRVCLHNPGNVYNCGRCEKCLRTMVTLEAHGLNAPTFPPLDVSLIRNLRYQTPEMVAIWLKVLEVVERSARRDLEGAIRHALRRSRIAARIAARLPALAQAKRRVVRWSRNLRGASVQG